MFLLLLLELLCASRSILTCPEECICNRTIVKCRQQHLSELTADFIQNLPNDTTKLDLSDNYLNYFPKLNKLENVLQLILDNNRIDEFPKGLQQSFPLLQCLRLRQNNISYLPHDLTFSTVKHLDISENSIRILRANVFHKNISLEDLDMSFNSIVKIEPNTFDHLQELVTVRLNGNKLRTISARTFHKNLKLKHVYIASNDIEKIDSHAFPPKVLRMYLQGNRIAIFHHQKLMKTTSKRILDLSNNNINGFSRNFLKSANMYAKIDISGNMLNCSCDLINLRKYTEIIGQCNTPLKVAGMPLSSLNEDMIDCNMCTDCELTYETNNLAIILGISIPCGIFVLVGFILYIRKKKDEGTFSCLGTQICCCCCMFILISFAIVSLLIWVLLFMFQDDE